VLDRALDRALDDRSGLAHRRVLERPLDDGCALGYRYVLDDRRNYRPKRDGGLVLDHRLGRDDRSERDRRLVFDRGTRLRRLDGRLGGLCFLDRRFCRGFERSRDSGLDRPGQRPRVDVRSRLA
jgi:hypothetical protein